MKISLRLLCLVAASSLFATSAFGQDLSERLDALEKTVKGQAETIELQQKTIDALKSEKGRQEPRQEGAATETGATAQPIESRIEELNDKVDLVVEAQKKEHPNEFNPAIGLVGETIFGYRSKGKAQTGSDRPGGFDAFQRSVELTAASAIDPFAKGYLVVNGSADPVTGEVSLGVEEAALQTTALPWNLELKAGRFFGEFGKLGYIHDHELPFVNRPLPLAQYIGGESRTDGLQLNWLVPIEHYVSLTVGAGNQFGGDNPPNDVDNFRSTGGVNYWSRLSSFFELTPDIALESGVSGLWNPKTNVSLSTSGGAQSLTTNGGSTFNERQRRLYGADLVLSYKPLRNNQFESVVWGSEVLYSDNRYDQSDTATGAPENGSSVGAIGLYSYLTYKFHRQWSTGVQYEFVENELNKRDQTNAYSANVTWALSHWNQLRLQYTHTDHNAISGLSADDAVYLQWNWIIGSHSHGWQQR